ncbi:MAG: amino acid permease [Terriglobales bacterium]
MTRVGRATAPRLERKLSLSDATALVVSNVIGVGIFTTPAVIAALVPGPGSMLALWLVGGILAFAGAVTYGELAKLCPRAGGEYNYLSHAFGPLAGFLSGWTSLIAGFSGAIAACAVALVSYLGRYFPTQTSADPIGSFTLLTTTIGISRRSLFAAAVILLFAMIHMCGLGPGRLAQKILALLILAALVVFIVAGFGFGRGSWLHFHAPDAGFSPKDWLLALIPVMFTYSGWNAAAYVSEEVRDPRRNVGKALALGTGIVLVLYLALNALYIKALSLREMSAAINVGDIAAQRLLGVASGFVTPLLVVALLGALSAMTIAGPRVYFAMARDKAFLAPFSRVSPRFRTPALAIGLQSAWSIILVLLGGFEQILIYTGFAIVLSSGATVTALYVIRRRRGLRERSLRTIAVPGVFFLACLLMVANAVYRAPKPSFIGLFVIAAGIPIFLFSRKRYGRPDDVSVYSAEAEVSE